jgi:molecular chaperone GrpE
MADDEHPHPEADAEQADDQELMETPEEEPEAAADAAEVDAGGQIEALQDQLLRATAEMENVRRRAARDVENAHKFALERITSDLLPVLDSLEKAIEAGCESDGQEADALTKGVELSLKLFLSVLEKAGVVQLDPLGEPFDPQVHEALAMVPKPDAEPNSVMEVMQKGYTLNGRVVRAAKVVVVSAAEN